MNGEIDPRDFGRLESEVKALHALVAMQIAALQTMTSQLNDIKAQLSEARGGWKTLMWMGGAAAAMGGFIAWALAHLRFA